MPTQFENKVYELCRRIPKGKVTTYGEIAHAFNSTAYRAVGNALKKNPYAPNVPCHRVVASDGSLCGFRGSRSGRDLCDKGAMLQKEGVLVKNHRVLDFSDKLFRFR